MDAGKGAPQWLETVIRYQSSTAAKRGRSTAAAFGAVLVADAMGRFGALDLRRSLNETLTRAEELASSEAVKRVVNAKPIR